MHGWIKRNQDDPDDDHIMSLGFIYNSCPGRDLLDREHEYFEERGITKFLKDLEAAEEGNIINIIILVTLFAICCLSSTYCCLKHRGKCCKLCCRGKAGKHKNLKAS